MQVKTAAKASKMEKTKAALKTGAAEGSGNQEGGTKESGQDEGRRERSLFQQKAKKPIESRVVAVKETSPEKIKTVQQKASPNPRTTRLPD